ncbi:30550_t:CDS:2, partial [Racocetra persica]
KSLLLTKLANHPDFQGNIYQGNFSLDDVLIQGNIFIDDLDLIPFALPSPDPLENQKQLRHIPNAIPGCRELDLAVLQQHQEGNFKEGLTG